MTGRPRTIAAACTVFLLLIGVQSNDRLRAVDQLPPLGWPTLLAPANQAIVKGANFTQTWSGVEGARQYEYQSYNDAQKTRPRAQQKVSGTTTKTIALVPSGTFWWQVRAIDALGRPGPWSALRQVTTDNEAPTIRPLTIIGDKPVQGTVRFVFESADKHLYRITSGVFSEVPDGGLPIGEPEEGSNVDEITGLNVTTRVALNINTFSMPNGRQTIVVNAGDRAGNVREERFYFTVANPAPTPDKAPGGTAVRSEVLLSETAGSGALPTSVTDAGTETTTSRALAPEVPGRVLSMHAERGTAISAPAADTAKKAALTSAGINGVQYLATGLAVVVLATLLGVIRFVRRAG